MKIKQILSLTLEDIMKRKLTLLAAVSLFVVQGVAYAATDITPGGELTVPTGMPAEGSSITKLSNNVVGRVVANSNQFSAITKHINGTKNYATATSETKIYWTDVTAANKGKSSFEIILSASDTSNFSNWTSL